MTHTPSLEIPEMRYLHHLLYHFDDIDQRTKIHHFIDFMVIHQFLISLMITEYIPITKSIKSLLFNKKSSFETTTSIINSIISLNDFVYYIITSSTPLLMSSLIYLM